MAAESLIQRGELVASNAGIFWLESDPATGLNRIITLTDNGPARLLNKTLGVRSQVNGYGGGALCAAPDRLFAVASDSQQILAIDTRNGTFQTLTNDPDARYGGLVWDPCHHRLLAVRECADQQQLVWIDRGKPRALHSGQDFYGAPALSASGNRIAWVSWQLPDMPWVASELWQATVGVDGSLAAASPVPLPATGCVQQPLFADETLIALSDHQGWWQPWQWDNASGWRCLDAIQADGANAPWQLGEHHHLTLPGGGWVRVRYQSGCVELWCQANADSKPQRLAHGYADFRCLTQSGHHVYCIARSSDRLDCVLSLKPATGSIRCLAGGERPFDGVEMAEPEPFSLPSQGAEPWRVSGFYYPPVVCSNRQPGPPPLVLIAHGGPTSMAYAVVNPQVQFLCHQGFAVADVNYRGSSGFGRAYRLALGGQWGLLDVEDMESVAHYLVEQGKAASGQTGIQGRSAGGYTALMAMASSDCFAAGVSQFGVSDPERLRALTHRFESGYLDWLLGPYTPDSSLWASRSPLAQAFRIQKPVAFFQGGQDRVVVPQQTAMMAEAIRNNGRTPLVRLYPDEGHGFSRADNQTDMLQHLAGFYRECLSDR